MILINLSTDPCCSPSNATKSRQFFFCLASLAGFNAWDDHLSGIELAYRTYVVQGLGFSPFSLIYGREPTLPTDVLYGSRMHEKVDVTEYHLNFTKRLRESYDIALRNQIEADAQTKIRYDAKQKIVTFQPGDQVILLSQNKTWHDLTYSSDTPLKIGLRIVLNQKKNRRDLASILCQRSERLRWDFLSQKKY